MNVMEHVMREHNALAVKRQMGVRREEFLDAMTFTGEPRTFFREPFGPLSMLKEEWRSAGASAEELDLSAFRYREPLTYSVPLRTGYMGPDRSELIEETDERIEFRNSIGARMVLNKGYATLAHAVDWPIKTADDWARMKPFYAFSPDRLSNVNETLINTVNEKRDAGYVIQVGISGAFWGLRDLMGEEEAIVSVYSRPELLHDILDTFADTACRVFDVLTKHTRVDMLVLGEDMAGKAGPLWGPKQVDEFIRPYYRRVWDLLSSRGARLFFIDSDGDLNPILDNLIDAGVNYISPCEPAAGMDITAIRTRYGSKLAMQGGINKHVLRESTDAIETELERKIPLMMKQGGVMLGLDHRIPNGVSLENYRFYINKAWEIMEREGM